VFSQFALCFRYQERSKCCQIWMCCKFSLKCGWILGNCVIDIFKLSPLTSLKFPNFVQVWVRLKICSKLLKSPKLKEKVNEIHESEPNQRIRRHDIQPNDTQPNGRVSFWKRPKDVSFMTEIFCSAQISQIPTEYSRKFLHQNCSHNCIKLTSLSQGNQGGIFTERERLGGSSHSQVRLATQI